MDIISPNFQDLLEPNVEMKKFPDGENYIRILPSLKEIKGKTVRLLHRLYPNPDQTLIQMILMVKTIKEHGAKVELVAPYLPYARQDKIWKSGEAISAKYVCETLKWAGVDKLITFDCHFLKTPGKNSFNGLEIENISLSEKLIEYAKNNYFENEEFEVVSPDLGASYMTGKSGNAMKKTRGEYVKGDEAYRKIEKMEADFDIKGKNVLIIDDMVSGGGTMLRAVDKLRADGAKKIVCCCTHGFFLKGSFEKLEEISDGIFCSNSISTKGAKINFMDLIS